MENSTSKRGYFPGGLPVLATIEIHTPGLNTRAVIRMSFAAPAGSNREIWVEIACEKALMMLDPA